MILWIQISDKFRFTFQNAVQSIKPIGKNLSEMGKELEMIEQVTSSGELRKKLVEAEEAKVEIEAILLKRVSLAFFPHSIEWIVKFIHWSHLMRCVTEKLNCTNRNVNLFLGSDYRTLYCKKHTKNGNNVNVNSRIFVFGSKKSTTISNQFHSKRSHYAINMDYVKNIWPKLMDKRPKLLSPSKSFK